MAKCEADFGNDELWCSRNTDYSGEIEEVMGLER